MRELPSFFVPLVETAAPTDSEAALRFLCFVVFAFSTVSALMIGALMVGA